MSNAAPRRSPCPIANALDLLGDRWTLLVIRDLLFASKRRYRDLVASPERIPTNILADRLRRLEASGIVTKSQYELRPPRFEYILTAKGNDLFDVLTALIRWGGLHVPGAAKIPEEHLQALDPRRRKTSMKGPV